MRRAMKMTPFLIKLVKEKQSKTNKIKYNMAKVKANAAEIVITIVAIIIMSMSSCGAIWQIDMVATCPAYAGVTEKMLGEDMYANQTWGEDEQSRPNYVFINY